MNNNHEIAFKLTQKELAIVHSAICNYRGQVGKLIGELAGMDLATDEARELSNLLGNLSSRMCDLLDDNDEE